MFRSHAMGIASLILVVFLCTPTDAEDESTVLQEQTTRLSAAIEKSPREVELYSQRGDAWFFQGRFAEAIADYEQMTQLDPSLDAQHWRRAIAHFYAGHYDKAAAQCEKYHAFDNVDRENGIWRYLCQRKAGGVEKARLELIKYTKDDREPFGDIYRMFEGKMTGEEILSKIRAAKITDEERNKRLFYAELYVGLNDAVEGRNHAAIGHLEASSGNRWGATAGYGPHYMWQVGRRHLELLRAEKANSTPPAP